MHPFNSFNVFIAPTVSPQDAVPSFISYAQWKETRQFSESAPPSSKNDELPPGPDDLQKTLDQLKDKIEHAKQSLPTNENNTAPPVQSDAPKQVSKKTSGRDRFNFASFDCGAIVLASDSGAKKTSAVLSENRDSYMINKCSETEKYLVVQLCDEILIDTIVLANFEFFSSIFKNVRFSVSDQYPPKSNRWLPIGDFVARNSRVVQVLRTDSNF